MFRQDSISKAKGHHEGGLGKGRATVPLITFQLAYEPIFGTSTTTPSRHHWLSSRWIPSFFFFGVTHESMFLPFYLSWEI